MYWYRSTLFFIYVYFIIFTHQKMEILVSKGRFSEKNLLSLAIAMDVEGH